MKNTLASIQSRLKNVAQKENKTYQIILIRYFIGKKKINHEVHQGIQHKAHKIF